jgi:hypothetical protein
MRDGAEADDDVSARLVLQRIRNRVIEYLELASSFERQLRYQASASVVVAHEVINQWEDWISEPIEDLLPPPVFTVEEADAVRNFNEVWKSVVESTPPDMPAVEVVIHWPEWERLRVAAETTLSVFARRGPLPEISDLT